jgi:hypothetical protein
MNAPYSGARLTAPHVTSPLEGYADEKQLIKEGRHVGLDFYDLLIEGDYTKCDPGASTQGQLPAGL